MKPSKNDLLAKAKAASTSARNRQGINMIDQTLLALTQAVISGDKEAIDALRDYLSTEYTGLHAAVALAYFGMKPIVVTGWSKSVPSSEIQTTPPLVNLNEGIGT